MIFRLLMLISASAACLIAGAAARGQSTPGSQPLTVKAASAGFAGRFKAGFWQPVRVAVMGGASGAQGELELVVNDNDQTPVIYRGQQAINLTPGAEQTLMLFAKSGPANARWRVVMRLQDGATWSQDITDLLRPPLGSLQELIVGIGPPLGLEEAASQLRRRSDSRATAAEATLAAELPDQWWGYQGVDQLVLTTRDDALLRSLANEQQRAIVEWVELGGRLTLCIGARGEELLAANSPWRSLVPGDLAEVAALGENSSLEDFTKSELPASEAFRRERPRVCKLKNVRGEVLLSETSDGGSSPLIVRDAIGLGQVTFVGLDVDHPSLADWKGRTRLLAALLSRESAERDAVSEERQATISQLGYTDLIGQLRTALDQFPGVTLVNFTAVAVLTGAYLLLIGPADYLLLSRFNWPRQVTWLTFPLVALAMIGLALGVGRQAHGDRVRLNQAEIIDIDLERQVARGTVWAHLFTPRTTHFDLRLAPSALPGASDPPLGWLAWQGLPGDALGGLESRQVRLASAAPYRVDVPGKAPAIDDLAVQTSASKSLAGCWWARTTLDVKAELRLDSFGHLEGRFHSPLLEELTECIVVHGDKLYRLGTLAPGQPATIDPQKSLNLEWRLTQRRLENSKDVSTPWEQDSTDVPRIALMLMFHEAARGRSYSGLTHRFQPQLDLSENARLGQAILVGRAAKPATELVGVEDMHGDGTRSVPTTWTWYRIILPFANDK